MTRKALIDEEGLAKEMASRVVECFAPPARINMNPMLGFATQAMR